MIQFGIQKFQISLPGTHHIVLKLAFARLRIIHVIQEYREKGIYYET